MLTKVHIIATKLPKMKKTIGERVREAREGLGINQSELARRVNVTRKAMNKIESGETKNPKAETLSRLSQALGKNYEWLMYGRDINATRTRLRAKEWDDRASLDTETFFFAPIRNSEFSMGGGATVCEPEEQYDLPIRRYTLQRHGVSANAVEIVRVRGDSMAELIQDDSVVWVDTNDKRPRAGKIFAFTDEDLLQVKYLEPVRGGGLQIRSHNETYPPETLTAEEARERIIIHGRAFIYSGDL